ncbi:MAG: hypothetical protein AB7H90_01525 [Alphaproteobacteria bacterium]
MAASSIRSVRLDTEAFEAFRRVERIQEEQEARLAETRDTVTRLATEIPRLQGDISVLSTEIRNLVNSVNQSQKPNYGLLIGGIGAFLTIAGLCGPVLWYVVTGFVEGKVGHVMKDISQISTEVQHTKSQLERQLTAGITREQKIGELSQLVTSHSANIATLTTQLRNAEERLAHESSTRRSQMSTVNVVLGEIEQQFHWVSNLRNLDMAEDQRITSMLWERVFPGTRWPEKSFYPTTIFQGPGGSPAINGRKTSE